jgi:branched-chain amino acid transport system substrate-binding protein
MQNHEARRRGARMTWRSVLIVLTIGALVLSACGDSSDNDAAPSDSPATTGASGAPSGEPIKVMTEAPVDSQIAPYPNIPAAAKVFEQWINDQGGIAGRPLEVIVCDDRADAAEAANCARTAAQEGVVANVGSFTIDASRAIPILEESQIAWFGACCPIVAQENTSEISFPMGCVACFNPAAAIQMVIDECQSPVQVYADLPVADVFAELYANGYKSMGLDPSGLQVVKIPLEPGDYTAQAAQVGDADCLFGNISEINWPSLITALNGVGSSPRLYGPQGNLNAVIAEQFPAETEGAIVINVYPNIEADVWSDYRAALETYNAPDLDWNSLAGLGTWAAFTAFTQIVESIDGEINSVSFLEAANRTSVLDTGGMVGVLDFTEEWTGGGGQFPRIFNRTVFLDRITGGRLTPVDGVALDMTKPFDGVPSSAS